MRLVKRHTKGASASEFALCLAILGLLGGPITNFIAVLVNYGKGLYLAYGFTRQVTLSTRALTQGANGGEVGVYILNSPYNIFKLQNVQFTVTYSDDSTSGASSQSNGMRATTSTETDVTVNPYVDESKTFPGVPGFGAPITFKYFMTSTDEVVNTDPSTD